MNKAGDRKAVWNNRYSSDAPGSHLPDSFLIDHLSILKPGSIYDLASGTGRNSIYLARSGFEVFSVDFSDVALTTLQEFSKQSNLNIETMEMDLNLKSNIRQLKMVDNILVSHYKIAGNLLDTIPSMLNENGLFLYYTYNLQHSQTRNFPKEYCLKPKELIDKQWDLELVKYAKFQDESGHYDGYLFRKI